MANVQAAGGFQPAVRGKHLAGAISAASSDTPPARGTDGQRTAYRPKHAAPFAPAMEPDVQPRSAAAFPSLDGSRSKWPEEGLRDPVGHPQRRTPPSVRRTARLRARRQLVLTAYVLLCVLAAAGLVSVYRQINRFSMDLARPEVQAAAIRTLQPGEAFSVSPSAALSAITEAPVVSPTPSPSLPGVGEASPTEGALSSDEPAALDEMAVPPVLATVWPKTMGEIVSEALPTAEKYGYEQRVVADGEVLRTYSRETPIAMPAGEDYAQVEGVLTFRGNNYRDTGAYGCVPDDASGLSIAWETRIGAIESWTGVGWTGQASIVRWPEETRLLMNINAEKKAKDGLCEVIYGALDGKIHFLDLEDGEETRDPIEIPSSIKGSVSVDPRGLPLLYCGQGIPEVDGREVQIGTRIFSLIDQECLFFLDGRDDYCLRRWYAFDSSPLIDAASDTMIQLGENGIVYTVVLNTRYDSDTGDLSIDPEVERMVYKSDVTTRPGMEDSPAVYDHYAYYTDNSGLLTCLDLNTLQAVWLGDVGDDSDATIVLEEDDGGVWLYTVCELDLNGDRGNVYCRKFNALTGEEVWNVPVKCVRSGDDNAGGFATPALGRGSLGDLVFFNVCRMENTSGALAALDKETGEVVWYCRTGAYSWSSPVCVYDSQGRGYVIICNSKGLLRLLDGLTGEELASVDLESNIEGTPAVFDDMLVVGTRGRKIFGVKITA